MNHLFNHAFWARDGQGRSKTQGTRAEVFHDVLLSHEMPIGTKEGDDQGDRSLGRNAMLVLGPKNQWMGKKKRVSNMLFQDVFWSLGDEMPFFMYHVSPKKSMYEIPDDRVASYLVLRCFEVAENQTISTSLKPGTVMGFFR